MKSLIFDLTSRGNSNPTPVETHYSLPILKAFAVEYAQLMVNGIANVEPKDFVLRSDKVVVHQNLNQYPNDDIRLIVHYHGIRDFTLLFPNVTDSYLASRLGNFYSEAELCFDQGAWLSYALMCGAIFEGMLFSMLGMPKKDNSFLSMIKDAKGKGLIDNPVASIMDQARENRNLVHAGLHSSAPITRAHAMDMRSTMDKLITM